jgi:dTDP-4-dehydrorhamnose reductase
LVHYSTDYVFDGTKIGAYCELDKPNPINVYGVSKLAGEQAIQTTHDRHLILRTSWVVGAHGSNFAKTVLRKASRGEALTVVADQFGAPTSASLIADITAHLVRQALRTPTTFPFGLYHVAASGETSWYTYACHVVERAISAGQILRMTPEDIKAIKTSEYSALANRPKNSKLDTNMLCNTFDLHLPHWKTSVDHVLDEIFTTYD